MKHLAISSMFILAIASAVAQSAPPGGTLAQYVDPRQQTALWFGARSHWLQPWRAYLETVPAQRLRDAVGINLNVDPEEADATCRHLAKNGFTKVRLEFGWGSIGWEDPSRLADPRRFEKVVAACKAHGLRPLFLLNAHHGVPCPVQFFDVQLMAPAKKGDRTVRLNPAALPRLVAGRSGLSGLTDYCAAEVLFTKIAPDGTATLSKPLPKDLAAGRAPAATLKFLPFSPSRRKADDKVPPEFEETMAGWLKYAQAIATEAKRVLGTEPTAAGTPQTDCGFDLEVWNELTFGSRFLSINNYYPPNEPLLEGEWAPKEILRRTVAWAVDPASRLPGVGVNDGFNNQWPWGAGSTAPPGLAALGKHPYAGVKRFPKDQGQPGPIRPLDAQGNPDGVQAEPGRWNDSFVPRYVSHFPEYPLSAIQTEHLIRDLSPITTELYGVKHGRDTRPAWPDGSPAPAPQLWITEVNLDPEGADPGDLAAYTRGGQPPVAPGLTPADADRMKAKAILRYLTCYTNKGPVRFYFFAAKDRNPQGLQLVSNAFFEQVQRGRGAYPENDQPLTSPTMLAVRRLVGAMAAQPIRQPRSLTLTHISEDHGHQQFAGDPATAGKMPDPHPPLWNRDVLGFFPFQAGDRQFVVAVYIMTRNLAQLYRPAAPATDPTRFDLPEEHYRLKIGGVRGERCTVSLEDPLDGVSRPVRVLGSAAGELEIDLPLTDSPRLLRIEEP